MLSGFYFLGGFGLVGAAIAIALGGKPQVGAVFAICAGVCVLGAIWLKIPFKD